MAFYNVCKGASIHTREAERRREEVGERDGAAAWGLWAGTNVCIECIGQCTHIVRLISDTSVRLRRTICAHCPLHSMQTFVPAHKPQAAAPDSVGGRVAGRDLVAYSLHFY